MPLLYHAYVYLEFLILACTIYILAPHIGHCYVYVQLFRLYWQYLSYYAQAI